MNPIQKNIANIIELDGLPPEEQQEMILRIGAIIYQNMLVRVMEIMTEKQKDEFEKLLDKNPRPDEVFIFLKENVPNFEKIVDEEALKLKDKDNRIMSQIGK